MPRRPKHEQHEFKLTVNRVEMPPQKREAIGDGMRILAKWLLKRHASARQQQKEQPK